MNKEALAKGKILDEMIKTTDNALRELYRMQDSIKDDNQRDNRYDDGLYGLHISKHSDGSGDSGNLRRYRGNAELLSVMIGTLEKQVKEMRREFKDL